MLLATLNAGFAIGALTIAMQAFRKGLPFLRYGWLLIQTGADAGDSDRNVERRHSVSEGGRFFLSGLLWLGGALLASVGVIYFGAQAFLLLRG